MASQTTVMTLPFPTKGTTILKIKVVSINSIKSAGEDEINPEGHLIKFSIIKIWGSPKITIATSTENATRLSDQLIKVGQELTLDFYQNQSYDSDGNGLAILKIQDSIEANETQIGQEYFYLHDHKTFIPISSELLRKLDSLEQKSDPKSIK